MEITTVGITGGHARISPTRARTIPIKVAVIGRSKCKIARKLEWGTTPARGTAEQGWGASAAPLPDIPLSAADELPPPLLDGGQGKINSTAGGDGGERPTDDGLQWTVTDDGGRVDDVRTRRDDMTAIIRDCFDPTDASCKLNSVDLPRRKTTPTHSSVVPPMGESTVNRVHPPPERSSARARKGVR
jgi:hypothetical protein